MKNGFALYNSFVGRAYSHHRTMEAVATAMYKEKRRQKKLNQILTLTCRKVVNGEYVGLTTDERDNFDAIYNNLAYPW